MIFFPIECTQGVIKTGRYRCYRSVHCYWSVHCNRSVPLLQVSTAATGRYNCTIDCTHRKDLVAESLLEDLAASLHKGGDVLAGLRLLRRQNLTHQLQTSLTMRELLSTHIFHLSRQGKEFKIFQYTVCCVLYQGFWAQTAIDHCYNVLLA